MLINILGGDGCGKSTQIRRLLDWTSASLKHPARLLAKKTLFDRDLFPECDIFGITYETLAHERLPRMPDEARALWLIYMNMALIRGAPANPGEVVYLDGFWQKHYATEAALGTDSSWLRQVCAPFPEPDLTILLDLDPAVIVARSHEHKPYESGCDFACRDENFLQHQYRVRDILLTLAKERGYFVVDANRPEEELFGCLCSLIGPHIEKHANRRDTQPVSDEDKEPSALT